MAMEKEIQTRESKVVALFWRVSIAHVDYVRKDAWIQVWGYASKEHYEDGAGPVEQRHEPLPYSMVAELGKPGIYQFLSQTEGSVFYGAQQIEAVDPAPTVEEEQPQ